ncbi:MAG: exo-alpha-sialidase [Phycisphaeraceae bacterium]
MTPSPNQPSLDFRNLRTGLPIPTGGNGYADQPQVVVMPDGAWVCCLTTGSGHEGAAGQHIVSLRSEDQGETWSEPVAIEPADGPEASWAQSLLVPDTGRIYVFYTYNRDNRREVRTHDGKTLHRVDSLGVYAYRYSDDGGRTWSADRYEIPMRLFACDRENVYGGEVLFFWGVAKPLIHRGEAIVPLSKVGAMSTDGFFHQNEGATLHSPNLLTEHDPAKHEWLTMPEGDVGVRAPEGAGPISGEFKVTPMNDGSLYGTFRTIDGYAAHAYSRDHGRSWQADWMRYRPGGRKVKNPRAANFSWRLGNGKYLYWFENHGGEKLARFTRQHPSLGYAHRNPAWLCGGVERDGEIHWSQPEILLYDDDLGIRFSYPDLFEDAGEVYLTETQKIIARVHRLDPGMLADMWRQVEGDAPTEPATRGLLLDHTPEGEIDMPELPLLCSRGSATLNAKTGATIGGEGGFSPTMRGGFTLELRLRFADWEPWQMVFDSRDEEGRGMTVMTTDRGTLKLSLMGRTYGEPGSRWSGGLCESSWDTDPGVLMGGQTHHVTFIVDGGPKLITVVVDGVLCDGGDVRQFGWGRFHPNLKDANGAERAAVAPDFTGEVQRLRLYDRPLRTAEAVANHRAEAAASAAGTGG